MRTSFATPGHCWACGHEITAVSDVIGQAEPKPGDVACCIQCTIPSIFDVDMTLRKPTEEEMQELAHDDKIIDYMTSIILAKFVAGMKLMAEEKNDEQH